MSRTVNTQSESSSPSSREQLEKVIGHAAHLLPSQGPIGVFIHHNTLHAFQHLPFEEAVIEAARKFGAEPFLTEARYQYEVRRGRIRIADIEAVLNGEADEPIWPRTLSRRELRRALIWPGLRPFSPENIEWLIEEEGILERLRDDLDPAVKAAIRGGSAEEESQLAHNLFSACCRRLAKKLKPQSLPLVRPAEGLKRLNGNRPRPDHPPAPDSACCRLSRSGPVILADAALRRGLL
jgi:hypothetical protein